MATFMLVITPVILMLLAFDGRFGLRHGSNRVTRSGMFLGLALGKVLRPRVAVHRFRFVIDRRFIERSCANRKTQHSSP